MPPLFTTADAAGMSWLGRELPANEVDRRAGERPIDLQQRLRQAGATTPFGVDGATHRLLWCSAETLMPPFELTVVGGWRIGKLGDPFPLHGSQLERRTSGEGRACLAQKLLQQQPDEFATLA